MSMEEAKHSRRSVGEIFGLPAQRVRMWLMSRRLRGGHGRHFTLPPVFSSLGGIMVVAPEEMVDALESAELVTLMQRAGPSARIVIVCEESVTGCFSVLKGLAGVVTYSSAGPRPFASVVKELSRFLGEETFDLCLLLQERPHETLVYLVGQSQAPLRIGYAGAASFPFLNVRIRQTLKPGVLSSVRQVLGLSNEPEAA